MKTPSQKALPSSKPKAPKAFDPAAKAFGMVVRMLRQEKKISQENFAALADTGRTHMGRIERGEKIPTLRLILKIAKALEISSAIIMAKTEEELTKYQPKQCLPTKAETLLIRHLKKKNSIKSLK